MLRNFFFFQRGGRNRDWDGSQDGGPPDLQDQTPHREQEGRERNRGNTVSQTVASTQQRKKRGEGKNINIHGSQYHKKKKTIKQGGS